MVVVRTRRYSRRPVVRRTRVCPLCKHQQITEEKASAPTKPRSESDREPLCAVGA